jgi:hypothetical protein
MSPRDEDRELQDLLRLVSAMVMLGLLSLIVVVAVLTPRDSAPDTTLLLGLATMLVGAIAAFFGVSIAIARGKKNEGDDDAP